MKIWCLFTVENLYDQPDHNLHAWWPERPSLEKLAAFLGRPLDTASDEDVIAILDIWKGRGAKFYVGGTRYRLQEVAEGGVN